MNNRVKRGHAKTQVEEPADDGQRQVHDRNPGRYLTRARKDFSKGIKAFRAEDLHATNAQLRQKHHGHNNDPDPTDPLQHSAPEKDPARQVFEPREHGRAGCRKPGHGFEKPVNKACFGRAQPERDRAENRQGKPNTCCDQEGLLNVDALIGAI